MPCILIVDDDADSSRMCRAKLQQECFNVIAVSTENDPLEQIGARRRISSSWRRATRGGERMLKLTEVPVIGLISAGKPDVEGAFRAGSAAFLPKPCNLDLLVALMPVLTPFVDSPRD